MTRKCFISCDIYQKLMSLLSQDSCSQDKLNKHTIHGEILNSSDYTIVILNLGYVSSFWPMVKRFKICHILYTIQLFVFLNRILIFFNVYFKDSKENIKLKVLKGCVFNRIPTPFYNHALYD